MSTDSNDALHGRSSWARLRIAALLARRQIWRTRWSAALVITLVAIPVAAVTGYIVVNASGNSTAEERVHLALGTMDSAVSVEGVPHAGFWQVPSEPTIFGYPTDDRGFPIIPDNPPVADPLTLFPAGTEALALSAGQVRTETKTGVAPLTAWAGKTWDPRFAGRFDIVSGRAPENDHEAMTTASALARLGVSVGDEVTLADGNGIFTITGILDAATLPDAEPALFLPEGTKIDGKTRWYLPGTVVDAQKMAELNAQGIIVWSRTLMLSPPAPDLSTTQGQTQADAIAAADRSVPLLIVGAAGLLSAYVIVMLAGAAFAVAARRQQRSLAIVASVGGSPADLRRTILLQGALLGIAGSVLGAAIGVGGAALLIAITSDGSATQYSGFHVPWHILAIVVAFATLVSVAAAVVPAHSVTRTDTLLALRGALRPQRHRATRSLWGIAVLLLGITVTLAGGIVLAVSGADKNTPSDSLLLQALPGFAILIGPILAQIGILLSGRWLLSLIARLGSRISVAARLASRDAAASPSRTVPAFAVMAVTVFIAVMSISFVSMFHGVRDRDWQYSAPEGTASISLRAADSRLPADGADPAAYDAAALKAEQILAEAGADRQAILSKQREVIGVDSQPDPEPDAAWITAVVPDQNLIDEGGFSTSEISDPANPLVVVAADEVETALGIPLSAAQLDAYRNGAALVADDHFLSGNSIEVSAWTRQQYQDGEVPGNIFRRHDGDAPLADPQWTRQLTAIAVDAPAQPIPIAIAPETAAALGLSVQPTRVLAAVPAPAASDVLDALHKRIESLPSSSVDLSPGIESGPPRDEDWLVPALFAVAVLVLGASGVALGLARFERRTDEATLTAIGATPALRRRIAFWQGLITAGLGVFTGTVAGVLPAIGFSFQGWRDLSAGDIPWLVLAVFAGLLPTLIALGNGLIPQRRPDLTRRTAIA